jgi:FtsP/CotA-like multicopper oxidase with cupredoxin domain
VDSTSRFFRHWWLPQILASGLVLIAVTGSGQIRVGRMQANLPRAVDMNPDPDVFETVIAAMEATVDLGDGLLANAYTYNGTVPGPEFHFKVGDRVIVHFVNFLPEPSSIHWHGVELNNASDGTPVTQNAVGYGEAYSYRFTVPQPGVYWYHPHFKPTNPEFKGQYGSFIVEDPAEKELRTRGVIPNRGHTMTLVLSDTTVCKVPGSNDATTFPADPDLPWAGEGDFPGQSLFPTPDELCENPRDNVGNPLGGGPLAAGAIPNVQAPESCEFRRCATNEGQWVLVNGKVPAARRGSPAAPGELADGASVINVQAGAGIRLQLIGATVTRYFRLRMTDPTGRPIPLYRIGGEGGLLDRVRLEGGTQDRLDTKFDSGEILLAPSDRADVVLVVPDGEPGDIATLWTRDYARNGRGFANLPTVPLLHLRIVGSANENRRYAISEGDPLRLHPLVNDPIENLRELEVADHLLDPDLFREPKPGSADETIRLTVRGALPAIDDIVGSFAAGGLDYTSIPHIASSRFARVGDLLELEVQNTTRAHHPFHLHGFSFQPIRVLDPAREPVLRFDYNELIDTFDIPSEHSLVFRVRLNDRPRMDGTSPGGALGRWLFHCHITFHATLGMISELVVLEP